MSRHRFAIACAAAACLPLLAAGACRGPKGERPGGSAAAGGGAQAAQAAGGGEGEGLGALSPPAGEGAAVDPFCGMRLRAGEAAATFAYKGTTYSFCSADHMEAFRKDPERYLGDGGGE